VNNQAAGDERPFVAGALPGESVSDRLKVHPGEEILVRIYVDNNANPDVMKPNKAVAKNVKVKVLIPRGSGQDLTIAGFVGARNAVPKIVNDTMSVYSKEEIGLEFVPGSAMWTHVSRGRQVTEALPDRITQDVGVSLGNIDPGEAHSGWIVLRVVVR
jgi:hypothetical protein